MMRACLTCGRPTPTGNRCTQHALPPDPRNTANYRRQRDHLLSTTHTCWICGHPPTPTDPLTADHLIPVSHGGGNSELRPAHRSCNIRRGATRAT